MEEDTPDDAILPAEPTGSTVDPPASTALPPPPDASATTMVAPAPSPVPPPPNTMPALIIGILAALVIGMILGFLIGRRGRAAAPAPAPAPALARDIPTPPRDRDLDRRLAGIEAGLTDVQQSLARLERRPPVTAAAPAAPLRAAAPRASTPAPAAPPQPAAAPPPPDPVSHAAEAAVESYRAMLQSPTAQHFAAWRRAHPTADFRIGTDGEGQFVPATLGSHMLAIQAGADRILVVPNDEVVTNFSTQYGQLRTMRPVVGDAFDLVADGGGALRLMAPAVFEDHGHGPRLATRGRIGGLSE